jgi:hypothetical protein
MQARILHELPELSVDFTSAAWLIVPFFKPDFYLQTIEYFKQQIQN